jgi:serine/threonine protein kinase/tetratricopeptide (TPR) repeat protein
VDRDYEKLRRLFDRVAAAPPGERASLLDRECADDPELRARVEAILSAAEDDRFLVSPTQAEAAAEVDEPPDAAPLREGPGTRIGPYTIVRQIGEGGFGAVFLAEQRVPVRRTVALKILKLGMDTREVVARFEQERQALALMDHPNIARVIDAGATGTGRPYFVMDFVEGEPIGEYCDRNHLTVDARLELFGQVCRAVQHAHSKGIIHRDLKPSNILVGEQDGKPAARIIDFGIAKAVSAKLTDRTLRTDVRQIIGTLQYMSPEQAEGSLDVDTRADVYALGVVLYELLTGTTPFDPKTLRDAMYGEIQRILREVDPPKPSTRLVQSSDRIATIAARRRVEPRRLGAIVRGELDWIVMRALEKDRGRRYATADALADDVRRYLGGEAVVAAPPSTAYRVRKFLRRNRAAATAGIAVAVSLLTGLVAFAWQARIARHERDRAVAAESEIAKRAEELRQVSDFQASMLEKIDPTEAGIALVRNLRAKHAKALAESGVPEPERPARMQAFEEELARVNATDTALATIDGTILAPAVVAIDKQFKDQPLVDARLRHTLANLYVKLGKYDTALPLQEDALETRRKILGEEDPDTLLSVNDMGNLLEMKGDYAGAEPLYREAMEKRARVRGAEHPETIVSMMNLGGNLRFQGRFVDAEPMLRKALEMSKRVIGDDAKDTLTCQSVLGYLYVDEGKLAEAEPLWRETYEKGRRALGPDDPESLVWANNLGGLLGSMGKLAEAEGFYREAYEATRRVRGEEHPGTLTCASNLASNLARQGRFAEAEPLARKTLETRRRVLGETHPDTIMSLEGLGMMLKDEGKLAEAEPLLRATLEARRRSLGNEHPQTLASMSVLAGLFAAEGKAEESEALYRESLRAPKTVWGDDHPDRLIVMNNLGGILLQQNRLDEAEPMLRGAFEARKRVSGAEHPETLIVESSLGRVLEEQGKLAEAEALFRDATAGFRKVLGNEHPNTASSLANVAGVLLHEGKPAEAEPFDREAIAAFQKRLGNEHPRVAGAWLGLGRALTKLARFEDAEKELLEANRVATTAQGVPPSKVQSGRMALVELYEDWEKAEPGKGHGSQADAWR